MKKYAKSLDRNSLRSHLAKLVGGTLPRALEEAIENYSWSAFAASSQEISAAHGLNFLAAEFSTIQVPDGGNAAIAQRVFERLEKALPFGSLRAQSLVLDVRMSSEGVETLYYEKGKPKRVLSKALIFACPKFVAAKLWEEMEAPRRKAIEAISYRAYLVGNVLYEGEVPANFYDLYLLNGHGTGKSVRENAEHQRATDVVNAGFAAKRKTSGTVFTLYQSFPFAEGRGEVLPDASFERWKTVFHDQFLGEIAPVLGLDPKRISGLRLHRWGHPVPVAKKGALIADIPETISKPHANRIFFVEQDNWLLPALETCALEALAWTPHVRKSL